MSLTPFAGIGKGFGRVAGGSVKIAAVNVPAVKVAVEKTQPKTQAARRSFLDKTVSDVHSGVIDEAGGAARLKAAGFPDSKNPFAQSHGSFGREVLNTIKFRTPSPYDTPNRVVAQAPLNPRLVGPGGGPPVDVSQQVPMGGVVGFGPGAAFGLGRQIAYGVGQNLTYAPGGIAAAVENPGGTLGELGHNLLNPNPVDLAVYGYLALHGGATALSRGAAISRLARGVETPPPTYDVLPGAHLRAPNVTASQPSVFRTALTRSSAEGGSLLHTPAPQPVVIHVPGARPVSSEGLPAEGPRPEGIHVVRPVSNAPLIRPLQRARGRIIQAAVNRAARAPGVTIRIPRIKAKVTYVQGPSPQAGPGPARAVYPGGTVFHGSPEGLITRPDTLYHTKPWREGIGFYVTEDVGKAEGYAAGRTAIGERRVAARAGGGAVTPFTLAPGTKVLDMNAPADMGLWQRVSGMNNEDFQRYVIDQAPGTRKVAASKVAPHTAAGLTNAQVRDEVLTQLADEHGNEAIYALEEGLAEQGVQATTHLEGKPGSQHRVWVVKDPAVLSHVPTSAIKTEPGTIPEGPAEGPRPATAVEQPPREITVGSRLNQRVSRTVSSRATVAREIRAQRRTDLALANSTPAALNKALSKLNPAEHEAITVASIAGDHALKNPAEAAGKQMAAHQNWFEIGGKPENLRAISDIEAAQKVLENPSKKFTTALQLAKEESKRQEDELVSGGHLTPETVQGRHDNAARAYGYAGAQPGSFFISQSTKYLPADMPGATAGVRAAPTAIPPPQPGARVPGLHQEMTGESYAGGYRAGPSVIARRGVLVNRLLSVERQYQDLWKIASPQRKSIYDIGVRDTPAIREDLRNFFNTLHDRIHADPEQSGALTSDEVKRVADLLQLQDPRQLSARIGSEIPGVRWVDSRYLADLGGTLNGVGIYKVADAINNPLRFSQLYARPAYILNLAGNLGMNGITEGVRVFPALRQAAASNRLYGDEITRWVDGGMGVSLSRSYSVGKGLLGEKSDKIAEAWNAITDMHSRRGAFYGEAARNGIKTKQQLQALKNAKPGTPLAAKRTLIFRIANKNIVDFGSLTPVEQNEIRRIVYFSPWVSRGTAWAFRAMVEHPFKTFTLYELGKIGAANAHRAFGQHLPAWFDQVGAVPFGGTHGDIRHAANFSSLNTYQTAVGAAHTISDTLKGLAGLPQGGGLGQALTPAATAFIQAGTANPTGAGKTGIPGLIEQQPIYTLLHRLGLVGKPSKTHPITGLAQGVLPFVIGGGYPQPTSHSALAKGAVKAARTPHGKLEIELDQLAEEGVLSQDAANTAKDHIHAIPAKGITYIRNMMGPRLDLAQKIDQWVSAGKITQEQATQVKASLLTLTPKQIDDARKALAVGLGQKPAPAPVPVG